MCHDVGLNIVRLDIDTAFHWLVFIVKFLVFNVLNALNKVAILRIYFHFC